MRALSVVGLLFACTIATASAQPIPMPPELAKFMTTPDEERTVKATALREWNLIVPGCGSPRLQGANVVVHVLPKFDTAGKPVSGRWQVVTRLEGCGQSRTFNLFYGFGPDGQMVRTGSLPGTTVADLRLQRDGLTYAGMGMAKLAPSGCKDFKILDTAFEALGSGQQARPWTEKWTVRACGVDGIVRMHFRPDATGTSISVSLDETVPASRR